MSPTEADQFANQYRALRTKEGWADSTGVESPERGRRKLWSARVRSVREAASIIAAEWRDRRPLVADIGAGGGWAASHLEAADVLAIDLIPVPETRGARRIRADMRFLPLLDRSVDAVLFVASLHYTGLEDAIAEASRVLRPKGLLVAVDSPIYANLRSSERAAERSVAYYAKVGYPELVARYHPLDANTVPGVLGRHGLQLERLRYPRGASDVWRRLRGRPPSTLLVARRRD